jgi:hypothetical protein
VITDIRTGSNNAGIGKPSMLSAGRRDATDIHQPQQPIDGLQKTMRAAWWRDLRPLEDGLVRLNGALYNGVIQLYGAHKVRM